MSDSVTTHTPESRDWTRGPAKNIAAILIGAASIIGIAWSLASSPNTASRGIPAPTKQASSPVSSTAAPNPIASNPAPPSTAALTPSSQPTDSTQSSQPIPENRPPKPAITSVININTASQAELELLPGIGPSLAQRIVEHREKFGAFSSVDELDRVKGIGPKILERLRPLVRID